MRALGLGCWVSPPVVTLLNQHCPRVREKEGLQFRASFRVWDLYMDVQKGYALLFGRMKWRNGVFGGRFVVTDSTW